MTVKITKTLKKDLLHCMDGVELSHSELIKIFLLIVIAEVKSWDECKLVKHNWVFTFKCLFMFRYFILLTVSENSTDNIMFVSTVEGETRCYDELGCLNITRDWYHLIYRPFNVFPLPREVIDTRFVLYTRKNPVVVSNPLFSYN